MTEVQINGLHLKIITSLLGGSDDANQHFNSNCNILLRLANVFARHYRKCLDNKFEKLLTYQVRKTAQCALNSTCFISHPILITRSVHWNYI